MKSDAVIRKFLYEIPVRFEPSESELVFNGAVIRAEDSTGKAVHIERIQRRVDTTLTSTTEE
ncbi:MAG: hypothetical protein A2293_08090 [Elusimicrobia bacterium RIFOXYB2_FULL_49_7]|nr:MAG: hypothetical protein A2293_08090 [Elusimicrobia bacterium RIFOXYB2_FULL_49_7]